jgi:hypothetical protein
LKPYQWLLGPFLSFFIVGLALGETYPINIRYQPTKEFPSLRQKIGFIFGIAPFKDERPDKPYIGHQTSFRRVSHSFKSEPFPLERAIMDSLSQAVSRSGVKTILISDWDGKPESLRNMAADSILKIEIKRFWTEGIAAVRGTNVITSIYLVIYLGVKKEGKVFRRDVYAIKESAVPRLIPAGVEQMVNQILTEILDAFFSNPY